MRAARAGLGDELQALSACSAAATGSSALKVCAGP